MVCVAVCDSVVTFFLKTIFWEFVTLFNFTNKLKKFITDPQKCGIQLISNDLFVKYVQDIHEIVKTVDHCGNYTIGNIINSKHRYFQILWS